MTDAFDLSRFDDLQARQEEGLQVEIKGPDLRTKLGVTITVTGPDSKRVRAALHDMQQQRLDAEDTAPLLAAEIDANERRIMAKATLSWLPPKLKFGGKEYECSEAAAFDLYMRYPFIFDQVRQRAGRRTSFTKRSTPPSAAPSSDGTKESSKASQAG